MCRQVKHTAAQKTYSFNIQQWLDRNNHNTIELSPGGNAGKPQHRYKVWVHCLPLHSVWWDQNVVSPLILSKVGRATTAEPLCPCFKFQEQGIGFALVTRVTIFPVAENSASMSVWDLTYRHLHHWSYYQLENCIFDLLMKLLSTWQTSEAIVHETEEFYTI